MIPDLGIVSLGLVFLAVFLAEVSIVLTQRGRPATQRAKSVSPAAVVAGSLSFAPIKVVLPMIESIVSGTSDLATASFSDAAGNPVSVDPTAVTWASSAPAVATVVPVAGTLTATVAALAVGTTTVTATDGAVVATATATVTAGAVASGQISFGALTTG